ncbi:MAG: response regulator [Bacteroidales bacterium]|nr:response regulator [Bacteroidales bacterium]
MNTTKKILVVDDDIDVINIIETILSNQGYQVITANNKTQGLEKLHSEKPDMAILDVVMTTLFEGFEMAKEIRQNPDFKNLPILLQTSIYVLETTENDIIKIAHEYRKTMNDKELNVILVRNAITLEAGIDYIDENKTTHWVPVNGFLKKPVESKKLLPEIKKLIG